MKSISLTPQLYDYLLSVSLRESDVQRRLREKTASLPNAIMQIPPEQGQLMALLAKLIDARLCIEIGVFTGYSALAVALALPADGRLIACDRNRDYTDIAEPFWREAGVRERIDLRIAPALETLGALGDEGCAGKVDMAFVDADKSGNPEYLEALLPLLRPRGLIIFDNMLWGGSVADPAKTDETTEAIRRFSAALHQDSRVDISLLPVADGLTLAMKRA